MQLYDSLSVFLLNIFWRIYPQGKRSFIIFRNWIEPGDVSFPGSGSVMALFCWLELENVVVPASF